MKKPVRDQINELAAMSVRELQQRYREAFDAEPESAHRQFLFRKIAWHLQAEEEGGLPEPVRQLAREIARNVALRNRVVTNAEKRRAGLPIERTATTTITPDHDSRLPMPGGVIVKQFRGETLVVKVTDQGFEFRDRRYTSLSAIAQEITGTKWNGFAFFGLMKEGTSGRR